MSLFCELSVQFGYGVDGQWSRWSHFGYVFKWHYHFALSSALTLPADVELIVGCNTDRIDSVHFPMTRASILNQSVRKRDWHDTPPQSAVAGNGSGRTSGRSRRLGRWQTNTASGICDTRNIAT